MLRAHLRHEGLRARFKVCPARLCGFDLLALGSAPRTERKQVLLKKRCIKRIRAPGRLK